MDSVSNRDIVQVSITSASLVSVAEPMHTHQSTEIFLKHIVSVRNLTLIVQQSAILILLDKMISNAGTYHELEHSLLILHDNDKLL